jgi:hypothetical protein
MKNITYYANGANRDEEPKNIVKSKITDWQNAHHDNRDSNYSHGSDKRAKSKRDNEKNE